MSLAAWCHPGAPRSSRRTRRRSGGAWGPDLVAARCNRGVGAAPARWAPARASRPALRRCFPCMRPGPRGTPTLSIAPYPKVPRARLGSKRETFGGRRERLTCGGATGIGTQMGVRLALRGDGMLIRAGRPRGPDVSLRGWMGLCRRAVRDRRAGRGYRHRRRRPARCG